VSKHKQRAWSKKEEDLLRSIYAQKTNPGIALLLKRTPKAVSSRAKKLRIVKGHKKIWTPSDDKLLRRLYPDTKTSKLATRFGCNLHQVYKRAKNLGLKKSDEYMASPDACRLRRGDNVGAAFRFKPGLIPANKGTRRPGWFAGRMRETQFKKGQKSRNWMPLGSTRFSKEGYLMRKVAETGYPPADWKFVHTILWEEANGPVPAGHAVAFKDRDRDHISLDNLELITRRELMLRNSIHNLPQSLKEVVQLKGAINRQITMKTRKTKPMEASA
jgi:hypothetical protein